jgi:hypothetical protein
MQDGGLETWGLGDRVKKNEEGAPHRELRGRPQMMMQTASPKARMRQGGLNESVAVLRAEFSAARSAGGTRPPGAFRGWNACATPGSVPGGRAPPGTYFQGLNPSFTINGADY